MSNDTNAIRGLMLDLDGTVWEDDRVFPGVPEALATLRANGMPIRFTTNTTRKPRSELAAKLTGFGIATQLEEIHTAPLAAVSWLRRRGLSRVRLLTAEETFEDFAGFEIVTEKPEAVVIGDLADQWTFEILNDAFRTVLSGAELVALQKNRYWRNEGELELDAGPFIVALEYATGRKATVVGKPNVEFFETAGESLLLSGEQIAVVGDDLSTDIAGAHSAGLAAIAVRTGKFRTEDEEAAGGAATAVLDSLADLPAWLGL
ncbi:MAG: TIGR01458 family HAD-type hydrolase [bacterium]|nr:TIGR01458 family HAD-type hydrolase [bacterium]